MEKNIINNEREKFLIEITKPLNYDRLHTLSTEYSVSVDFLINTAIEYFLDEVDFVRRLRVRK